MTDHAPTSTDASTLQEPAWRIPEFTTAELAQASIEELLALLIEHQDRVPHSLIDACVARGESMVPHLSRHLARLDEFLDPDDESGEWWMLLHAVHILGRIPGVQAGETLVRFMRDLDRSDDDVLCDWIAGMWPHFFVNKPAGVIAQVHAMVRDDTLEWTCRAEASSVVVAAAMADSPEVLEAAIDECAAMVADENESEDLRGLLATQLLDFPRSRHRQLMLRAAALSADGLGQFFSEAEVLSALKRGTDRPQWLSLPSPYNFYDVAVINARQQRWTEEIESVVRDEDLDDDFLAENLEDWGPPGIPFVRETPKVGRNDPCPCGSGKKYKKCCLK